MFFRLSLKLALFALFFTAAFPAFSQVAPAATTGGFPLSVGGGVSYWDTDWGQSKMEGATVWVDYYLTHVPYILKGLGVELEARDVTFNKGDKPNNFRQATVGGESSIPGIISTIFVLISSSIWPTAASIPALLTSQTIRTIRAR
jgi:hypothetical protein